jgi:hypothetical protein
MNGTSVNRPKPSKPGCNASEYFSNKEMRFYFLFYIFSKSFSADGCKEKDVNPMQLRNNKFKMNTLNKSLGTFTDIKILPSFLPSFLPSVPSALQLRVSFALLNNLRPLLHLLRR